MAEPTFDRDAAEKERSAINALIDSKAYIENPEVLGWYTKDLEELKPDARAIFEQYSKIPSSEVISHIKKVRDEAFKELPYPCLGHWGFLDLSIGQTPVYDEVLSRVKSGEKLLDVGCCLGQDIRKLVHDGAPSQNIYATDIKSAFWGFGFDLFLDKSTLNIPLIEGDFFDINSDLKDLNGTINIAHMASFFHMFDWNSQVRAATRAVQLLKPEAGSLIFGRQGGKLEPGDLSNIKDNLTSFWHNPESFAKLWAEVGDQTNSKWKVEASLGEEDMSKRIKTSLAPAGCRFMTFTVRRL